MILFPIFMKHSADTFNEFLQVRCGRVTQSRVIVAARNRNRNYANRIFFGCSVPHDPDRGLEPRKLGRCTRANDLKSKSASLHQNHRFALPGNIFVSLPAISSFFFLFCFRRSFFSSNFWLVRLSVLSVKMSQENSLYYRMFSICHFVIYFEVVRSCCKMIFYPFTVYGRRVTRRAFFHLKLVLF